MSVQIENLLNLKKSFEFSFLEQQMCPVNKVKVKFSCFPECFCELHLEVAAKKEVFSAFLSESLRKLINL